jgi:hypothetical protein
MWLKCDHIELAVLVRDDVQDKTGEPVYGLFVSAEHAIYIARCTPRKERRRVLVHELSHAYEHNHGKIDFTDEEGRANRISNIETAFNRALESQDGEQTIHSLFGEGRDFKPVYAAHGELDIAPLPSDVDGADQPIRICCPHCHQSQSPRNVHYGAPSLHLRLNIPVIWGTMQCHECEREVTFLQMATNDGVPLPKVVDGTVTSRRMVIEREPEEVAA